MTSREIVETGEDLKAEFPIETFRLPVLCPKPNISETSFRLPDQRVAEIIDSICAFNIGVNLSAALIIRK
jgi:hypothetical protein